MGTSAHDILGRDDELGELRAFVTRDGPRSMVIEGEAGIGKTTLWRAAADEARARGIGVLSCSPAGGETRLSFAALSDLLTPRSSAPNWGTGRPDQVDCSGRRLQPSGSNVAVKCRSCGGSWTIR